MRQVSSTLFFLIHSFNICCNCFSASSRWLSQDAFLVESMPRLFNVLLISELCKIGISDHIKHQKLRPKHRAQIFRNRYFGCCCICAIVASCCRFKHCFCGDCLFSIFSDQPQIRHEEWAVPTTYLKVCQLFERRQGVEGELASRGLPVSRSYRFLATILISLIGIFKI